MKQFFELIDRLNACSHAERPHHEAELMRQYRRDKAVVALDMSGFSLTVRRSGIVSYLCCIRRMQQLMVPLVAQHGGELVKFEADNLLAVFDEPRHAVSAGLAMKRAAEASPTAEGEVALAVGVGIDFGPVLLIPGQDCFGDAVNIAYKLGEDVARPGEVLVTDAVHERLGGAKVEPLDLSIAGLRLSAYRVLQA
jgi:adenylate cyclase